MLSSVCLSIYLSIYLSPSNLKPSRQALKLLGILNDFKLKEMIRRDMSKTVSKHNRKCNGFNGYNGNCIGFNGNYNGVYWYVMDSIGGVLNPIGKMPKTHYKKQFCNGFTGKS